MNYKFLKNRIAYIGLLMAPLSLLADADKPTESAIVARFQGTVITEEELTKASTRDLEKLELDRIQFNASWERNKHQVLEMNLSRLLEEKLLQAEASKRGITANQLLDSELKDKYKEPTEADVKAYYEANSQRIKQPLIQITSQIYSYLKARNYNDAKNAFIEQLKRTHEVKVSMQPLRSSIDTKGSPSKGPSEASVTLVEFSDFQCPYCAGFFKTLYAIMKRYPSQVRLVYRNFPLSQLHPDAEKAAEAALCAADQGQFWQMHDLLFQTQSLLTQDDLKAKAAQLKLDVEAFNSCLASGRNTQRVKQDLFTGIRLGVTGTPTLFINGRFISGAVSFEDMERIIDEELSQNSSDQAQGAISASTRAGSSKSAARTP
jgi:protein-disulfide isomerase